jgi:hypothetical protein
MIGSILGIISNGLRLAADWFGRYSSKENTAARQTNEDTKSIDTLHSHLKEKDLDAVRKDLS